MAKYLPQKGKVRENKLTPHGTVIFADLSLFLQILPHINHKWIYRKYVYSAVVYQKYLTRLRELIIFEPWRENYHFSQPS